jgi:hypothetical protein
VQQFKPKDCAGGASPLHAGANNVAQNGGNLALREKVGSRIDWFL